MKNRIFFLVLFVIVLFSSCQSQNNITVPGEKQLILKNIYSEYFSIAESYMDLKKYDKAIIYYKKAMQNKSLKNAVDYKLARCYALNKNYSESQKIFEELLKKDPENKDLKLSLAYVLAMKGEVQKSLDLYLELETLFPDDSTIIENQISLYLFKEDLENSKQKVSLLKEKFTDNKNIASFEEKIKQLEEKLSKSEENSSESEINETSEKNIPAENEQTPDNSEITK